MHSYHLQNNEMLRAKRADGAVHGDDRFRDQGLTRPKVLIVTPMRNSAHEMVTVLRKLMFGAAPDAKANVVNAGRFEDEFGVEGGKKEWTRADVPADFKHTFRGNIDDCFRVGIAVTKKSLKL